MNNLNTILKLNYSILNYSNVNNINYYNKMFQVQNIDLKPFFQTYFESINLNKNHYDNIKNIDCNDPSHSQR